MGSGAPTIGIRPKTIPMFTATYKKKAVAKLKQYNLPNTLLETLPIDTIRHVITMYNNKLKIDPKNPNSSENKVKIKSAVS